MARQNPPSGKAPRGQRDMSLDVHEWRFEVGRPDHGERLDGFLRERLSWRSRSRLRAAVEEGAVEVLAHKDPQRAELGRLRAGLRLRAGQEVVVRLPAPQAEEGAGRRTFEPSEIPVVYEDEHLLAVNKPPQLNVYPTRRHRAGSLIELVHQRERDSESPGIPPSPCHRLDRETSGLLLFSRNRPTRVELQRQFEEREVEKSYLALVEGEIEGDEGCIDRPIERDTESKVEIRGRAVEGGGGQPAVTRWRVRERLEGRTLVELFPETGRQHQLRIHLATLGHPIVGDKLYLGGDDVFLRWLEDALTPEDEERLGLSHQALHAARLTFVHPESGKTTLEAPLWEDMETLLARSR
jgi:23S rRNA pseudouridine1911/1915/1917 synthase